MFVREATQNDTDVLVQLGREMAAEIRPHLCFDEGIWRKNVETALQHISVVFFVAQDGDEVVGFLEAQVVEYQFTSGYLASQELVYVRPDKRGTRAAARLFRAFAAWGESINAKELYAGVASDVHPDRTAKFMEHFGFRPVGSTLVKLGRAANV